MIKMYRCSHFSAGNNTAPLRFPVVLLYFMFLGYTSVNFLKNAAVYLVLRVNII